MYIIDKIIEKRTIKNLLLNISKKEATEIIRILINPKHSKCQILGAIIRIEDVEILKEIAKNV